MSSPHNVLPCRLLWWARTVFSLPDQCERTSSMVWRPRMRKCSGWQSWPVPTTSSWICPTDMTQVRHRLKRSCGTAVCFESFSFIRTLGIIGPPSQKNKQNYNMLKVNNVKLIVWSYQVSFSSSTVTSKAARISLTFMLGKQLVFFVKWSWKTISPNSIFLMSICWRLLNVLRSSLFTLNSCGAVRLNYPKASRKSRQQGYICPSARSLLLRHCYFVAYSACFKRDTILKMEPTSRWVPPFVTSFHFNFSGDWICKIWDF